MADDGRSNAFRWLFGLPFTAAGVFILWSAVSGRMTSNSDALNESPFIGILAGLLFLVPGLWALQLHCHHVLC
jgi:hypothetical protein